MYRSVLQETDKRGALVTTPAPALADMAEQHTADLRALTDTVTTAATAGLAAALATAQTAATTAWITTTGDLGRSPGPQQTAQLLRTVRSGITTAMDGHDNTVQHAMTDGARAAAAMGSRHAAAFTTAASGEPAAAPPNPPGIPPEVQQLIDDAPERIGEERNAALALLTTALVTAAGWAGVAAAFNTARRAVSRLRAAVSWVCGTSAAAAVIRSTRRAGAKAPGSPALLVWVAEPGACPACAAYAGRAVKPGGMFPGGLTIGPPRTAFATPVAGPPRHSHCRCVLVPWRAAWAGPGSPLPALLRQRARSPRR